MRASLATAGVASLALLATACSSAGTATVGAYSHGPSQKMSTTTKHNGADSESQGKGGPADADEEARASRSKVFDPETPDNVKYKKLKDAANVRKRQPAANGPGSPSPTPLVVYNAGGLTDPGWYPPDWNGAAGGGRYVEVINNKVGFYKASLAPIASDTTFNLAGTTSTYVGDPEIVYDPATKKFYYAMIDEDAAGNWYIDYGFSKSATPIKAGDFCHFKRAYGTTLPDYPRLGGTKDFILIGTNNYANGSSYVDSSVQWAKKPGPTSLTACPTTLSNGVQSGMPFTPVPAKQTDPSSTGYILASTWYGGSTLQIEKVTKSSANTPVFGAWMATAVNPYSMPADSPQPGTTDLINTFDNRLFQVQQSFDPAVNSGVLWTANNTFAGAGSGVQWYELMVAGPVVQQGLISDNTRYLYNGSVAPDRAYRSSTTKAFGSNMVATMTAGSAGEYASAVVASKRGTSDISPLVTVKAGTGPITCGSTCRWGDRSSASAALGTTISGTVGRVAVSNGWANGGYQSQNSVVQP